MYPVLRLGAGVETFCFPFCVISDHQLLSLDIALLQVSVMLLVVSLAQFEKLFLEVLIQELRVDCVLLVMLLK